MLFYGHTTSKIGGSKEASGQNNASDPNQQSDPQLQEQNSQKAGQLQSSVGGMRTGSKKFTTIIPGPSQDTNNGDSNGQGGLGNGNSLVAAAKALLKAVALNTIRTITNNPVVMVAKNLFNKTLVQSAVSLLEAAQIDEILGNGDKQQIILLLAQAKTVDGEASQNIEYWKEVIQQNKQLERQTHDMAKAAG